MVNGVKRLIELAVGRRKYSPCHKILQNFYFQTADEVFITFFFK